MKATCNQSALLNCKRKLSHVRPYPNLGPKGRQRSQSLSKFLTDKELAASPEGYSSSKIQKMRKKSLDKSAQRQKKATRTKTSVEVPYFHNKSEMLDTSINAGKRDTPFRDSSPGFESCNRSPYQPSKRSVSFKKSKKSQKPTTPFRDFKYSSNKQNFDYQQLACELLDKEKDSRVTDQHNRSRKNNTTNYTNKRSSQKSYIDQADPVLDEASTHDDDDSRVENYFELEYKHSQKELLKAKSKLYEYRYKIDALKKKLIEIDQQRQEFTERFDHEQNRSDKYFAKAEKYKVKAKDFRSDNERLSQLVQQLKAQKEEDMACYEQILQKLTSKEEHQVKKYSLMLEDLVYQLNTIDGQLQQGEKRQTIQQSLNKVYDSIMHLNETICKGKLSANTSQTESMQSNHPIFYIGDNQNKYKVSTDAIIYSGESLNGQEMDDLEVPDHSVDFTPCKNISLQNPNQSRYSHVGPHTQSKMQTKDQAQSIHQSQSHHELLSKIQKDMLKIKEESAKVLEENNKLVDQNKLLHEDLSFEQQRVQQSLLPQYKEALEQMRLANDMMQHKIKLLESDKRQKGDTRQADNTRIQEELNELKHRMQQYQHENNNFRQERDQFVDQIYNLQNYNRTQENMIKYFQGTYTQMMQGNMTQPVNSCSMSMDSSKLMNSSHVNNAFHESLDLRGYIAQKQSKGERQNEPVSYDSSVNLTPSQFHRAKPLINPRHQQIQDQQEEDVRSQQYFSNRSSAMSQSQNQDPIIINQGVQKPFVGKQRRDNESTIQIDSAGFEYNDKSDQMAENEHLFSLSSTQQEGQLRMMSPHTAFMPRKIDFQKQSATSPNESGQSELFTPCSLYEQQPFTKVQNQKQFSMTATNQQQLDMKSQSQHFPQRELFSQTNSGNNSTQGYNQILAQYQEFSKLEGGSGQKQSSKSSHRQSKQNNDQFSDTNTYSNPSSNPRSSKKNQNDNLHTQETFQMKNQLEQTQTDMINKLNLEQEGSKVSPSKKNATDKSDKENTQQTFEGGFILGSFNNTGGSYAMKSPNFVDPDQCDFNNSGSQEVNQSLELKQKQLSQTKRQSPFMPKQFQKGETVNNPQGDQQSNFTSERTFCLKKEITSLDDEILQLQNSLKQALQKKGTDSCQ